MSSFLDTMNNMADYVNKEKQSSLDSFITQTPKPSNSNKRSEPDSSPDFTSPSTYQIDKTSRLENLDSPLHKSSTSDQACNDQLIATSVEKDTIFQLSEVVCATLKNHKFIDAIIPLISEKVMELVTPQISSIVDKCLEPHLHLIKQNKDALTAKEAETMEQKQEIQYLKNKLNKVEARLEEQEQYSRRTSLRFNNVPVPTDTKGAIIKPIDTDALILNICKTKLNVNLDI